MQSIYTMSEIYNSLGNFILLNLQKLEIKCILTPPRVMTLLEETQGKVKYSKILFAVYALLH